MLRFLVWGALWSVGAGLIARAQEPTVLPPARRETTSQLGLDELLTRWEKRGASRGLDVKFSLSDRSSKWDDETFEGRFVRQSPDRSCMELVKVVGQTKAPSQKIIRDGKRFYLYRYDTKQVVVLPSNDWRDTKDVGSALRSLLLASPLRLSGYLDGDSCPPFLFDLRVAEAKASFRLELVKETAEVATLRFIPLTPTGRTMFESVLLELDKRDYVPRTVVLKMAASQNTKIYRFTSFTRDGAVADEDVEFKPQQGWEIIGADDPS